MREQSWRRRFTIVELMIAVAIVSILAAIAVPLFNEQVDRARFAEVKVNFEGIRVAVVSVTNSQSWLAPTGPGDEIVAQFQPDPYSIGKKALPWNPPAEFSEGWGTIGWAPDGDVRCSYALRLGESTNNIDVYCDVDGDGMKFYGIGIDEHHDAWPYDRFVWACTDGVALPTYEELPSPSGKFVDQAYPCD